MRNADARLFTSEWYRQQILQDERSRTLVNEAVWVDEADIFDDVAFHAQKRTRTGPVRVLMPTRLIKEKGLDTLLQAVTLVELQLGDGAHTPSLVVDVIGAGPMKDEILAFIAAHPGRNVEMSFIEQVPYGAPLFTLMRQYDAFLVANLSQEQPRIIYDGFSQGLPCIASRTAGIVQVTRENETALLFTPGSVVELAERLTEITTARDSLAEMGARALDFAQGRTHQAMHRDRAEFLLQCFG